MLREQLVSDARQRSSQGRRDDLLRKGAPFVLAFVAGFLLARQRGGDSSAQEAGSERRELTDALEKVRQSTPSGATAVTAGEQVTDRLGSAGRAVEQVEREFERVGQSPGPGDTEAVGTPASGIDADVADYSPPTIRGMPMLGVGTYHHANYEECLENVQQALRVGYRHIDTAEQVEAYYNEAAVGDAVAASTVDREDLFVATKVAPADLDRDGIRFSAEESLDRLDVEYVDLLYVHWPTGEYDPVETLDALAQLRQEGLIEHIGVSNFTVDLLEEAVEVAEEPIFANQVEMHPLLPQEDLRLFCSRDDVDVELVAYSPIARGDVEHVAELREVAHKHGATPEQVSLAWLREKGVTAIPRATTEQHLRENWLSLALDLDDEDVAKLDTIEERERIVDRDDAPWNR